jgi:hypothetical protein
MNPLSPTLMTPTERRRELCAMLARGVIRLRMREKQLAERTGESSLHIRPGQSVCRHATDTETAA